MADVISTAINKHELPTTNGIFGVEKNYYISVILFANDALHSAHGIGNASFVWIRAQTMWCISHTQEQDVWSIGDAWWSLQFLCLRLFLCSISRMQLLRTIWRWKEIWKFAVFWVRLPFLLLKFRFWAVILIFNEMNDMSTKQIEWTERACVQS